MKIAMYFIPIRVFHGAHKVVNGGRATLRPAVSFFPGGDLFSTTYNNSYSDSLKKEEKTISPAADTVELFKGTGDMVVHAAQHTANDAAGSFAGPTPSFAGPTTISFDTGWQASATNDVLPEHRVEQFKARYSELLDRGVIQPDSTVEGTFYVDRSQFGDGAQGLGVATWASGVISDLIDQVELAAAKLGSWYIKGTDAEPQIESVITWTTWTAARCDGKIKIEKQGDGGLYADGHLRVIAIEQSEAIKLYTTIPSGLSSAIDDAKAAADAYSGKMAKALAVKASGGTPEWPDLTRPPETESDDLPDTVRKLYDEWWLRTSEIVRRAGAAVGPTEAAAFANYIGAGGTLTLDEWRVARDAAVESTSWTSSLWGYLKSALSYAGDKGEGLLKWAGDSTVEIAKDWGPAGVVGVYGGVKAVNALDDNAGLKKWLPWIIGGLAVLVILK